MGNSWSKIASQLPGRTDNDVKNFWHSYTRSRRIQQQQHANKAQQSNGDRIMKSHDGATGSCHEQQYKKSEVQKDTKEQGQTMNKSEMYPKSQRSSENNPAGVHLSACKPNDPIYATLKALSHTDLMSCLRFDQPNHMMNQPVDTPDLLLTQEASIMTPPFIPLHPQPLPAAVSHPHPTEQSPILFSAFYQRFPSPTVFDDQDCTCSSITASSTSFQHFPPLKEASDPTSHIITALPSTACLNVNDRDCTVKVKGAVYNSNSLRTSHVNPHKQSHHPHAFAGDDDYPSAGFPAATTSAAVKSEFAPGIKPPDGLQSVIWRFLNGHESEASAATDGEGDHYRHAHYTASDHYHHHLNQMIKPQLALPNYLLSDQPPDPQLLPSDHFLFNAEALSYTCPTNLQGLQAQYLADCFS